MDINEYLKLSPEDREAVRADLSEGELYALEQCLEGMSRESENE